MIGPRSARRASFAVAFGRAGANLALVARSRDALEETADEVASSGPTPIAVEADVGDPDAVRAAVDRTVESFGTLDILVNNAGAAPFLARVEETRLEGFEKYLRVTSFRPFRGRSRLSGHRGACG